MRDQAAGLTGVDLDDPHRVVAARRLESGLEGSAVLDRLCALAARLLSAGSAQVSLLTDVQVVAGGVGLGADAVRDGSTPRADSLCTVAAGSGLPLVVPDARQDARVRDLPPVVGGAVGTYLGVPLTDGHGYVAGVFCVYDAESREWSDDQVSLLQELATAASAELGRVAAEHERDLARLQLGLALDSGGIGSWDWDVAARRMSANSRLLAMFGLPSELEHAPTPVHTFAERVHPEDRPHVAASVESALTSGAEYAEEYRVLLPDGQQRWLTARGRPLFGADGNAVRLVGAAYDTTDNHQAAEHAQAESSLIALIARASELLAGSLEAEDAVRSFARLVVPVLADWSVVSLVGDDGRLVDVDWWHHDPAKHDWVGVFATHRFEGRHKSEGSLEALRSGTPFVTDVDTLEYALHVLRSDRAKQAVRALDLHSVGVFPLAIDERVVGLITLARDGNRAPFSPAEVEAAADLSRRASRTLANARTFSRERELSEQLQRSMLTEPVAPEDVEVAVRYLAASQAAQVGGDWYDAFAQPDGDPVIVVGDVVGHDTLAATVMGQLRSILRGISTASGGGPAALLRDLDRALVTLQMPTNATVLVARLERHPGAAGRVLTWSNAGHPPPIMVDDRGRARSLGSHDTLLGVVADLERHEESTRFSPAHTLLMYSDGLVERRDEDIDAGIERLARAAEAANHLPLEEMLDQVVATMLTGVPEDDVVLLALRMT
jgi:PAS domain S-box-containing protein